MGFLSAVLESAEAANTEIDAGAAAAAMTAARGLADEAADVLRARHVRCRPSRSLDALRFARRQPLLQAELQRAGTTSPELAQITQLATSSEQLTAADRQLERRHLREAAELYDRVMAALDTGMELEYYQDLVRAMKNIVSFKRAKCLSKITQQWRDRVRWIVSNIDNKHTILVNINIGDPENLQEILNALFTSDRINVEISRFAEFFLESIVPIMSLKVCFVDIKRNMDSVSIKIMHEDKSNDLTNITSVIDNFILFFETVQSTIDFKWEDDRTVFSIFGQIASKRFFDIFVEGYLEKTVPEDVTTIKSYDEAISQAIKFDAYLNEIRFTDEKSSPLLKFSESISEMIYERKCQNLLSTARNLMNLNLQKETVFICEGQISEIYSDEMEMLGKELQNRNILHSPYLLTQCCISKSAKDIMETVLNVIDSFHNQPMKLATKIISTLRNIIEMYYILTPKIHNDALNTNPLDLALFYNNCFYLAHGLLGYPWDKMFPKDYAMCINIQLADQIHDMRKSAILKFSSFMKLEQQYIEDTIANCELNNLEKCCSVGSDSEIAISRCLDRLRKLQKDWQPVLTADTYQTSMSNLVNCLCCELVKVILTIKESILKEDLAEDISSIYKPVITTVPQLFNKSTDYKKLSRHFCRISELSALLTCQIFTIANMWKSENSQLTKHFSCEEVKHFIRIMFPGNPQKSAVLNMIQ